MALEFGHFTTQSFEKLVQALSVEVLGPGTCIFGSGPDGAREATYEGEVSYPSEAEHWNGYIVVQAKCRETLLNDARDAAWLCRQLEGEFLKFIDKSKGLRRPEYYILASNVRLSADPKNGGKRKVDDLFKRYKKALGLRGWSVWSADELSTFLARADGIRRTYIAWLTPSDILSTLLESLSRPALSRVLPLALARDLRSARDIRLRDAGQETDEPIHLENAFVDLPLVDHGNSDLMEKDEPEPVRFKSTSPEKVARFAVSELLRRMRFKLSRESDESQTQRRREKGRRRWGAGRIVLLGGPGQGKSTVVQYLMQHQRAKLLSTLDKSAFSEAVSDLTDLIIESSKNAGLSIDGPARFPIRVNLPDFADKLRTAPSYSLLAHITSVLSKEIDLDLTSDDLRTWFGSCPLLLVLDGLDEVPPAANRQEVLKA